MRRSLVSSILTFEGTILIVLPSTHGTTCVYSGVVTHIRASEGIARKVGDSITELVVTRHDEASLLAVEVVTDVKCYAKSIVMLR